MANPDRYERYIAVDDACGWPLLIAESSGDIGMLVWPKPNHGFTEGAVQFWKSTDQGRHWRFVGVPVRNNPGESRLNVAGGELPNGGLIALESGETKRFPADWVRGPNDPVWPPAFQPNEEILSPVPAVSHDGGKTWDNYAAIPPGHDSKGKGFIPYGPIKLLPDGNLGVILYNVADGNGDCGFFVSADQGRTWTERGALSRGQQHNETAWIQLANGDLFAAARTLAEARLDAFRSKDLGRTWTFEQQLTMPADHPASLTALPDGRILLSYGIRNKGRTGIDARIGDPTGKTWGIPINVVDFEGSTDEQMEKHPPRDGGYPSTVVLKDGSLLTAYYTRGIPAHNRYHVGVVIWTLPVNIER